MGSYGSYKELEVCGERLLVVIKGELALPSLAKVSHKVAFPFDEQLW